MNKGKRNNYFTRRQATTYRRMLEATAFNFALSPLDYKGDVHLVVDRFGVHVVDVRSLSTTERLYVFIHAFQQSPEATVAYNLSHYLNDVGTLPKAQLDEYIQLLVLEALKRVGTFHENRPNNLGLSGEVRA